MEEKQMIEKMLEEGKITKEEADELLEALKKSYGLDNDEGEGEKVTVIDKPENEETGNKNKNIPDLIGDLFSGFFGPKHEISDEIKGEFEVDIPELFIKNTNGRIEVNKWEKEYYFLKIRYKIFANSIEDAKKAKKDITTFKQSKNSLILDIKGKNRFKISADIKLFLPANTKYDLKIESINGKVMVNHLRIKEGQVETTNGKVDVFVEEAEDLQINVTNGLINTEGPGKDMTMKVKNGNINVKPVIKGYSSLYIETINGNSKVYLPADTACYLEGNTNTGNVSFDFDNLNYIKSEQKIMRKHLIARTPDWEEEKKRVKIKAKTVNGNIKVKNIT